MRILMACAAFPPFIDGGGPISALMIAKLIQQSGHELEVVNVADREEREIYDGIQVQRLSTLNIDWNYRLPRPWWKRLLWHALENFNPRAFVVMRRQIRRFRPDIVLTDSIENVNVATWAAARSCGVPVAHILRSAFLLCWKGSMHRASGNCSSVCASCQCTSLGKKFSSRFVDAVVGETRFIVNKHTSNGYFQHASAHVIPGLLPSKIAPAPRGRVEGRPIRMGYLGVLDEVKGLDILAEALHLLGPTDQAQFFIAGTANTPYGKGLPAKFPSATRFVGWVRPDEFLKEIDVLVMPSVLQEAFGRVIIEAFGSGVPVIGSSAGGIPETIEPGKSGLLFPVGDAPALASLLRDIIADPGQLARLSEGALQAAYRYTPEKISSAYDAIFAELQSTESSRLSLRDAN
jgi:glycosyltransferase involved in cell wall biosynthesis